MRATRYRPPRRLGSCVMNGRLWGCRRQTVNERNEGRQQPVGFIAQAPHPRAVTPAKAGAYPELAPRTQTTLLSTYGETSRWTTQSSRVMTFWRDLTVQPPSLPGLSGQSTFLPPQSYPRPQNLPHTLPIPLASGRPAATSFALCRRQNLPSGEVLGKKALSAMREWPRRDSRAWGSRLQPWSGGRSVRVRGCCGFDHN